MTEVLDRFLRYVRMDSASVLDGPDRPSSQGQLRFAELLEAELSGMGGAWTNSRLADGSLLLRLPASPGYEGAAHSAFLAHLDTYYGLPGAANPRVVDDEIRR